MIFFLSKGQIHIVFLRDSRQLCPGGTNSNQIEYFYDFLGFFKGYSVTPPWVTEIPVLRRMPELGLSLLLKML